jgi:hypothetical protein
MITWSLDDAQVRSPSLLAMKAVRRREIEDPKTKRTCHDRSGFDELSHSSKVPALKEFSSYILHQKIPFRTTGPLRVLAQKFARTEGSALVWTSTSNRSKTIVPIAEPMVEEPVGEPPAMVD